MTMTLDRPDFSAVLDSYASDLVTEIREDSEFERYGLDMTFIPRVLEDDIVTLVPAEMATEPTVYNFVLGYVSAKVIEAFRSN